MEKKYKKIKLSLLIQSKDIQSFYQIENLFHPSSTHNKNSRLQTQLELCLPYIQMLAIY